VLARVDKLGESLALMQQDLKQCEEKELDSLWTEDPTWAWSLHMYIAALLDRMGRAEESRSVYRKGIALGRDLFGDTHPQAQDGWRVGTMRLGLRIQQHWASEALRTCIRQMNGQFALGQSVHRFDLEEIDWARLRWNLEAWDGHSVGAAFDFGVSNGGLSDLWNARIRLLVSTAFHAASLAPDSNR
jgi:hypothetical protein